MKAKQLVSLAVGTVVLVLGALYVKKSDTPYAPAMGQSLLTNLDRDLNKIVRVEITSPNGIKTALTRKQDAWTCESRYGYPAQFEKLRTALIALSKLKSSQPVTLTDAQRATLKLMPPSTNAPQKAGIRVAWFYDDKDVAGSLIIGDSHHKNIAGVSERYGGYPDGQYVATEPDGTAYLIPDQLEEFSPSPSDWLNAELVNVGSEHIQSVTVKTPGDDKPLHLPRKEGTTSLMVSDLGRKEEEVAAKLTSVASALAFLNLSDVADPSLSAEALGMDKATEFDVETDQGKAYKVLIGGTPKENTDQRYIRISASALPQPAPTNTPAVPSTNLTATTATTNTAALAAATAQADVEKLNTNLGTWTFIIPSYKAESMLVKRADLVTKKDDSKKDDSSKPKDE